MGAGIHVYAETVIHQRGLSDRWVPAECQPITEAAFIWRDYEVFAALAGVRTTGKIQPITKPRGLPEDMSTRARELFEKLKENYKLHHHGWLTLREIKESEQYWKHMEYSHFGRWLSYACDITHSYKSADDYRILFAFDN